MENNLDIFSSPLFSTSLLFKGGPIIIPMIFGSIVAFGIVCQKLYILYKIRSVNVHSFIKDIYSCLKEGNPAKAVKVCSATIHPVAALFKNGIQTRFENKEKLKDLLEKTADFEIKHLENYMGILATIVSVEPMLGFLGTIIGLIRSFMSWEQMGDKITVSALAGGIYEAMITTAVGLTIAIPYFIFYNYIINRIRDVAFIVSNSGDDIMHVLTEFKDTQNITPHLKPSPTRGEGTR